jgi:short-subunit dehydrogenase
MTSAAGTALSIVQIHWRAVSLVNGSVLVTGASGGIGQAISRAFAARGASVILSGRRRDVLEPLASELGGQAIVCDLAVRDEVDRLVGEAGEIDVLVANAGLPASGTLPELTQGQIDRMLEINLRAPIALAHALVPGMIERRRGHLVFISSLAGKAASAASSIYSATKFGLRGFALALRADLAPHDVGASVVLPGFISGAGLFADSGASLPAGIGTRTPEDVAAAVLRAVERNRAEVDVAPLPLRLGATLAGAAPGLAEVASRRMGGDKIATHIAAGQRDKR